MDSGQTLDRVSLERIIHQATNKTDKIKDDAGLVGSVVHGLIEDFLQGKKIPNQSDKAVVNCFQLFLDWWKTQEYQVVELEKKIFSKKHNYAGTLDLVLKDKQGNLVLADIKTSNHISFDYTLQLNAYKYAYEEETKQKIAKGLIIRLPKKDSKIEVKELPLNKEMFNAFLGAKYMMLAMESNKPKKKQKQ
jgi:CRISPR/Cas system-associated exonuclease Cas4 (RecB family)